MGIAENSESHQLVITLQLVFKSVVIQLLQKWRRIGLFLHV